LNAKIDYIKWQLDQLISSPSTPPAVQGAIDKIAKQSAGVKNQAAAINTNPPKKS